MPSSNKAITAVRVPSVNICPPTQPDNELPNRSNGLSSSTQLASSPAQDAQSTPRMWTYRVRGIPVSLDWEAAASLIQSTLKLKDWELSSLALDPTRTNEQVATFEVLQPPYGVLKPRPNSEWQFRIYEKQSGNVTVHHSKNPALNHTSEETSIPNPRSQNGKTINRQKKSTVTVDKHFLGLTPLNRCDEKESAVEYVPRHICESFN